MGEVFAGRYELVEPIGHGGMGTVWIALDQRDECYRAAKVLRQADAASLLRFVREQSFRISHAHCVTPRGWAGEDDRVLFTMDLVRGGSVATLLGDYGPLPPAWAAVLLDQLLAALDAVHHAGLVHRDVKPANLLLEPTGAARPHLRLSDFGVAVPVDEPRMTQTSAVLGTPGYQAPEQLRGEDPDPRSDLWAAGVVLAELLTGQLSLTDDEPFPAAAPGVEPTLWALARTLTAPGIEDRPDTATAARGLLFATGHLRPAPEVPDDDGRGIEVLEQIPSPEPDVQPGRDAQPGEAMPARGWRSGRAWLGVVVIGLGLAFVVAAVMVTVS